MSKPSSILLSGENNYKQMSIIEVKTPLGRTIKDSKVNTFKSPLKPSFSLNKNTITSPIQSGQKLTYNWKNLKSPNEKFNPGMISIENLEFKENSSFESRVYPLSKRDSNVGISITPSNEKPAKGITATIKPATAQAKSNKKSSFYNYEPPGVKKSTKPDENNPVNLTAKSTLMKEPPKKASLPTNLKLTLEKIYTKEGSCTHRIQINSPTSECSNKLITGNSQRKNLAIDTKAKTTNSDKSTGTATSKETNAKTKLNTLLVGLATPSAGQMQKIPKLNVKNLRSEHVTPRKDDIEAEIVVEEGESTKRYKRLVGMLKEKNNEIKKLSQDNIELQCTLGSIGEELKDLRKMKYWVKEKSNSLVNIQLSKLSLPPEEIESSLVKNPLPSRHISQKSMHNMSIGEPREFKKPMSSQHAYYSNKGDLSKRGKKEWASVINQKGEGNSRKADKSQNSSECVYGAAEKSSISMSPYESTRIGKRTGSGTPEKVFKGKRNSMVTNELSLGSGGNNEEYWSQQSKSKVKSLQQVQSAYQEKRVNRNGKVETIKENPKRVRNETSLDSSLQRRKFSHDSNLSLEKTQSQLRKKNTEIKSMTQFELGGLRDNKGKRESQKENLDIGKALNDIKDRIARLLTKRTKEDERKLQAVYLSMQQNLYNEV